MPFVKRNANGSLDGLFEQIQEGYGEEFLPDDNPEVVAFSESVEAALAAGLPTEVLNLARAWNMTPSQAVWHIHKMASISASSNALN